MKQLKSLSLKGVLRNPVIIKKNVLQPLHLWGRVCGLYWKIFVSVGSFSFLLIPSWKEGEDHPISIVLAMCFQLIEVLNWEHWRSILSNWNIGILNFRSTHFRPYWQISNCPLGNGNQVEVQAQGQMALPTVSDWYFHFTPSARSEFTISDIVNVFWKVFLILYQDTFWRHQSLVRMDQYENFLLDWDINWNYLWWSTMLRMYEGSDVELLLSSFVVNGFEVLHVKGISVFNWSWNLLQNTGLLQKEK